MEIHHENNDLLRLVVDIYAQRDDDIFYDEAVVLMERCAEELLSDEQSKAQFPQLWRYFDFYPDGYREYEMLMDMARLEAAGGLKVPESIPAMPTEQTKGIGSWFEGAKQTIGTLFSGFRMQSATRQRTRSMAQIYQPVEIELDEGNLLVTFDVVANPTNPQRRDLHCYVETEEEMLEDILEFAPVWLQQAGSGLVVQEQALNEMGDATFSFVSPGDYTFGLYLATQEYVVENVVVP